MMGDREDLWAASAQDWDRFGSPFRPHPDDCAVVERHAAALAAETGALSAVMLGVTQEIAGCAWPAGTQLRAFDSSRESIDRLWPARGTPAGATAHSGDWSHLPLDDATADIVTADGSLVCLSYPDGMAEVVGEVRRVLRDGGRFVVRTFLRPEAPEPIEQIMADLDSNRIENPFVLKLRVDAALHDGASGFSMQEKWHLWQRLFPDQPATARAYGWPLASLAILPDFQHRDLRFVYPTLSELRALFASQFVELECAVGSYALSDRSPTLVLEVAKT
jgi:SAM-dependent methyltransferase